MLLQNDAVDRAIVILVIFIYDRIFRWIDNQFNENEDIKKVPTEIRDYGYHYDNLYDVIFNGQEKIVKDEEI